MTNAAAVAKKVAKKFDTRNPFEIASSMGFVVLRAPLTEIRGFLQVIRRIGIIYINDELDGRQSALVCAHELGHWFMHRGLNRAFLDAHTDFVLNKYEIEANRFAACLLFDDDTIAEYAGCTIEQIAQALGVTQETAEYRMSVAEI